MEAENKETSIRFIKKKEKANLEKKFCQKPYTKTNIIRLLRVNTFRESFAFLFLYHANHDNYSYLYELNIKRYIYISVWTFLRMPILALCKGRIEK